MEPPNRTPDRTRSDPTSDESMLAFRRDLVARRFTVASARSHLQNLVADRGAQTFSLTGDGTASIEALRSQIQPGSGPDSPLGSDSTAIRKFLLADRVLWSWSSTDLKRLASVLDETATGLMFVEPTAGLGWRHHVNRIAPSIAVRRYGHGFDTDVPAALRSAGLVVTTAVRFREGATRNYVWGEARPYGG